MKHYQETELLSDIYIKKNNLLCPHIENGLKLIYKKIKSSTFPRQETKSVFVPKHSA